MLKRIFKTYLTLFAVFYVGYSFLNWFLTTKLGVVRIDKAYSNFWIPFILIYIPTFFILRPIVKKSGFRPKTQDGLLWVLLPFSISIPTAFSQQYFQDLSYQIINVESPDDVLSYPVERFFKIKNFRVLHDDFTLYKERHVSGGRSKSLEVNNYYIAPMYGDTINRNAKVAYGVKYSTSLNHGLLFRDEQPQKIKEFNIKTDENFYNNDLYKVTFFERQMDSEDAQNFAEAWKHNNSLDQNSEPVILVNKQETIQQLFSRERGMTIYSIVISLVVTLCLLLIFNHFKKQPSG